MGVTNIGQQTISLDFKAPGQARLINQLMHGVVPTGIMYGFVLAPNSGANTVTIESSEADPSLMLIADTGNAMSIRCECTANITIPCEVTKRTVIARFSWLEVEDNFVDFYCINELDVEPTDIILGTLVYDGSTLTANVDYSARTNSPLNTISELDTFFDVLPDLIPSQKIRVSPGKAVINGVLVETSSTIEFTMPDATGISNDYIRYDIAYINPITGSVAAITGTANTVGSATVPPFPTEGLAIAIIKRKKIGSVLQGITGSEITSTKSIFNSYSGKVGNFYCGNYPTTTSALFKVGGGTNIAPKDLIIVTSDTVNINAKITTSGVSGSSIVDGGMLLKTSDNAYDTNSFIINNSDNLSIFRVTSGGDSFFTGNLNGELTTVTIQNINPTNASARLTLFGNGGDGYTHIVNDGTNTQIQSNGTLNLLGTKTNINSTNGLAISCITEATSTTTGALTVAGGVGIGKNLRVQNAIYCSEINPEYINPAFITIREISGGVVTEKAANTVEYRFAVTTTGAQFYHDIFTNFTNKLFILQATVSYEGQLVPSMFGASIGVWAFNVSGSMLRFFWEHTNFQIPAGKTLWVYMKYQSNG